MLLQYPKLSNTSKVACYDDYRKAHHTFIRAYKNLYEEVAGFSLLPERFINEASPIIERFIEKTEYAPPSIEKKIHMQVIRDFVSRFYDFIDEATELFTEHQALADQAIAYMEKVSFINQRNTGKQPTEAEQDYLVLLSDLDRLTIGLKVVREQVDITCADLENIKPVWEKIRGSIDEE